MTSCRRTEGGERWCSTVEPYGSIGPSVFLISIRGVESKDPSKAARDHLPIHRLMLGVILPLIIVFLLLNVLKLRKKTNSCPAVGLRFDFTLTG